MPELPEVECVRRGLESLRGRSVTAVQRGAFDVVHAAGGLGSSGLLVGDRLHRVHRHGKQLALEGQRGGVVAIHLGMTGTLDVVPAARPLEAHTHVRWRLGDDHDLRFRDPRRFGGVWVLGNVHELHTRRWSRLGPDALRAGPAALHARTRGRRTALKAFLLDQSVLAGLGNIYVDELLYAARVAPWRPVHTLTRRDWAGLVRRMRTLLGRAIAAGGSTLRDYRHTDGQSGRFQERFRVYGRAGQRCRRRGCRHPIERLILAGRSTHVCGGCQGPPPLTGVRE